MRNKPMSKVLEFVFVESKSCIELFPVLGVLGGYISLRCASM